MKDDLPANGDWWKLEDGSTCPKCEGQRLNTIARNVVLESKKNKTLTLPQLLALSPSDVIKFINSLKVPALQKPILETIVPEIEERLNFMEKVGLGYLS